MPWMARREGRRSRVRPILQARNIRCTTASQVGWARASKSQLTLAGAFFTSGVGVGVGLVHDSEIRALRGGTPQAQYFVLLHELAHFFQADQGFIQNDGSLKAQESNNDLLWDKCSKTIKAADGGAVI